MKYTKAPWFAVEYGGHWDIQDGQYYGDNCIFDEDVVEEAKDNVHLAIKAPEMYEALKGIYAIRDLLFYPTNTKQEHLGEAIAVSEAIKKIESLLKGIS